jgi:DNA mismatch endonuclease (patch repair protein)
MTDCFDASKRSEIMSHVKGADTSVEIMVRSLLHGLGYRFRIHVAGLPGKPDIVLPKHRRVIFVNGCFWHGHKGCTRSTMPKTNSEFWARKILGNMRRDKENVRQLRYLGWRVLVIWQCQTKKPGVVARKIETFFGRGIA